jgi:hypothetical protein
MFRRRTDQVYSTLQQVQRRITEQAGNVPALGDDLRQGSPAPQQGNLQPLTQALPQQASGPAFSPPPLPESVTGRRYVLQLSGDMAMLLMVVWLASMAVMFFLGRNWSQVARMVGTGSPRSDAAAERPTVRRQGDFVLVLQSAKDATVEAEKFFQDKAAQLNDFALKNAGRGWKPYFGVRKPVSGGVQLVFGLVDGVFGVGRDDYLAFAEFLAKPPAQGGVGYASASWVPVDGQ